MIEGVNIKPLKQILDERGKVMHMLKNSDPEFKEFGEIYFSCIYKDAIKAWHKHKNMTLNYSVPVGNIKFVLYDSRPDSKTFGEIQEIFLGPDNYCLVTVPPLVWNGFKGIGEQMALVANCATMKHDPDEIERKDPYTNDIPYDWKIRHR